MYYEFQCSKPKSWLFFLLCITYFHLSYDLYKCIYLINQDLYIVFGKKIVGSWKLNVQIKNGKTIHSLILKEVDFSAQRKA